MEEAERLYTAMPTPKPAWDQLGDVTKNVWRGFVERGTMLMYDVPVTARFSGETERLLVERVLPLCSAKEIAMLYRNLDPSWPFPVSSIDPKGDVAKELGLELHDFPLSTAKQSVTVVGTLESEVQAAETVQAMLEDEQATGEPQMNAYTGPPPEAVVIPPAPAAPKPMTLKERLALKKGTA